MERDIRCNWIRFWKLEFRAWTVFKYRFVLISAGHGGGQRLCVLKVLSLFRMSCRGVSNGAEYALLQHIECKDPVDNIDERLGWVGETWKTVDEIGHVIERERVRKKQEPLNVGIWFGIEPFSRVQEIVLQICGRRRARPFSKGLHWCQHHFTFSHYHLCRTTVLRRMRGKWNLAPSRSNEN